MIATVLLFAILFQQLENPRELWVAVTRTSPLALLAAVLLSTADRVLMAYKWLRLLALRGLYMSTVDGTKMYCSALIWGLFLPASVGADVIRSYSATRSGAPLHEVVASIVIERLGGILVTAAVAVIALALLGGASRIDPRLAVVWWASAAISAVAIVAVIASVSSRLHALLDRLLLRYRLSSRVAPTLRKFHATFQAYRGHSRELVIFLFLTAAEQLFPIAMTWLIALGMGVDVPPVYLLAAVPIAFLFSRIPISLGGLGVYEGVFAVILQAGGVPLSESLAIALTSRVVQIVSWLPWWLMYTRETGTLRMRELESGTVA